VYVLVQLEVEHPDNSNDEVHVLSGTAPVGCVLMPGSFQQLTTAAHSAPNELFDNRQKMSSPLSLGDRASTTTSISEVTSFV